MKSSLKAVSPCYDKSVRMTYVYSIDILDDIFLGQDLSTIHLNRVRESLVFTVSGFAAKIFWWFADAEDGTLCGSVSDEIEVATIPVIDEKMILEIK